ncbi:hypothetical protein [Methylorubrum sp. DB1722]|uniref:hypothetical protein n=1 Tax=Methylorubrum sp. DB1722 TaxID=2478916 RepID=UPI0018E310D8|nr:hypothetical protein [Methylorubrum sp. DB1722]MBI1689507.1 hypothetical protein [Methylorubrum sp. DB1722]
MSPELEAVVAAAAALVDGRRWYLDLPADRALPGAREAELERALVALRARESGREPPREDRS